MPVRYDLNGPVKFSAALINIQDYTNLLVDVSGKIMVG
jgi:hypothetical protein